MQNSQITGRWGEQFAEEYFQKQGYVSVQRNFRLRGGEIDLIMARGQQTLFVEVKTRHAGNRSSSPEDISEHQVRRLLRCAEYYVVRHGIEDWRFVLACIVLCEGKPNLRLIELTEGI